MYNGTPYYFLKNLQGDIIAIVNENRETVARYRYDAWGVCTITGDTSNCNIATINPFRYRGYYYDEEIAMYYLQSRYYDPMVGRFINADSFENAVIVRNAIETNLYSYCEFDPVNSFDSEGNVSWKKAISIFNTIGKKIKEILNYVLDSINLILGVNIDIDWKIFSKIAKEIKRSPHKVKQWYKWLADKVRPLHKKVEPIVHALGLVLFVTAIAEVNLNPVNVLANFLDQILTLVVVGINKLFSWLCKTAVKALSKIVPALGGVLGMVLGAAVGRLLDAYFEKRKSSIVTEFSAKVSFRTFKIHDYFLTFLGCLA